MFYKETTGDVPLLSWLKALPDKVRAKCRVRLGRLAELGHELRRPEADFLRDGVYELRVGHRGQNYRMLYFFHRREMVVLSHGLVKEAAVPPRAIDLAVAHKKAFAAKSAEHTYIVPSAPESTEVEKEHE